MYASAFCGVMTMFATVGVASANTDASPIICAVTPAEFTPFHVFDVVVTTREMRRHGFALLEFVRMMVGVFVTHTSGHVGPRHFCVALHLSHRCRPDYIFTSSPARLCRPDRPVGGASRVVSTDSPARVASVFPG